MRLVIAYVTRVALNAGPRRHEADAVATAEIPIHTVVTGEIIIAVPGIPEDLTPLAHGQELPIGATDASAAIHDVHAVARVEDVVEVGVPSPRRDLGYFGPRGGHDFEDDLRLMGRLLLLLSLGILAACASRPVQAPSPPPSDDPELSVALAETLVEAGAHKNAVPILRGALAKRPKDARLHYLLGTVLRERGQYAQAEAELRLALNTAPTMAPAHDGLALVYALRGQHARALTHHDQAVKLAPKVPRFLNNRGFTRVLSDRLPEAISDYEAAIRLDPSAAQTYVNLGFALARQGQDADALRAFRQALTEAEALNNLALAKELAGQPDEARRLYGDALKADPGLREALDNLTTLEAGPRPSSKENTP